MVQLEDGTFFATTVGLTAEHDNYPKAMLVRMEFTSETVDGPVTVKAVNGHSLGPLHKAGKRVISRDAYEDRPRDNVEEARWAGSLLGWEM